MLINQLQECLKWSLASAMLWIATAGFASVAHGETVMKMSFSSSDGNMQFHNSMFSILSDGQTETPGDLNMTIDYMIDAPLALSSGNPSGAASVTMSGLMATAPPVSSGSFMLQVFDLGTLTVYDEDHAILLSANLIKSGLQGALGPGDKQGLFLGFGHVTGGSIAHLLDPESLQLRMKFPKISNGFSVSGSPNSQLGDFTTWTSSVELMAIRVIPEPSTALLLGAVTWGLLPLRRRRWP
jgi:hypothetical protein